MKLLRRVALLLPRSVREPLLFELRSYLGEKFSRPINVDPSKTNYVNLGSGDILFDDYINVDLFPFLGNPKYDKPYYGADLRRPLRIASSSIDGFFSEHTFEHLTFTDAERLFRECARALKPRGRMRVIVPDVSLFLDAWCRGDQSWFREWERLYLTATDDPERAGRTLVTPMTALSFVMQEYGHLSAWDFATLKIYLERAGFTGVVKRAFREGDDPRLLRDLDTEDRRFVSLYVEAVRP
jgi:SAM-dependent methyltransferase